MEHLGFPVETIIVFIVFVLVAFCIDFMAHKKDDVISLKSAVIWSVFWVVISVLFGLYIYYHHGSEMASLFFAGYALEKALSVDNLFVMMAIFSWFKIPEIYRHRVLYFGILGAIIFRLIFVAIGSSLLMLSSWVEIVFAFVVAYTAIMMLKGTDDGDEIEDYSQHLAYRLVYKYFPVFPRFVGHSFFISRNQAKKEIQKDKSIKFISKKGLFIATPLFLCLCVVEVSDVMFAFDSVPAIIAVSREPLIIYSAMIFAILGLRTLYFVLEALKRYLIYLEKAVIVLLFFIAFKLLVNGINHIFNLGFEISANLSLIIILTILAVGIIASYLFPEKN
ncbi:TerC/Alx family metal homeostasis membrane protein [Campylobacter geochelonis]|uniref:Inner membrane protein alx n=1 Tax=Campylobacter geochelonis TaxID=1780362 RepID=A0A128ELK3_9BACT|nr:TerC/Alx family metal homeostasis membrane protein [Campylobacter geochelonis]QKF72012.1 membrane protein, TerC family [Campylobacter geochelonis]CZE46910.1 Inner membrane protein alx [Campylobacter geochelonis]CZE49902.1 Inner membrane protein alx [Campylobacter geochelonis]